MITGVASIGNGADTLHYAYRPGLSQLDTATWRNSQDAVLNSRTYAYDAYHRLTGINLNNASEVAYTLNDKDQRTAASYAVGGACVSEKHAGFVVNKGGATSADVEKLLCDVRAKVHQTFGVELEPEIRIIK